MVVVGAWCIKGCVVCNIEHPKTLMVKLQTGPKVISIKVQLKFVGLISKKVYPN